MQTTALPAAGPTRPRTLTVGVLFGTAATFVAFCALVAIYTQQRQTIRASGGEWFAPGTLEMGPAGMMMMTLTLSVVTAQWAVQAARDNDRPHGFIALGVTLMFGAATLNQFWFVYQDTGLAIDDSVAALMFYVVTGSFLVMLVVAMAMMTVTTLRALLGSFGRELAHTVQASALFWHSMVVCYFLVWYVVFITK